MQVASFTTYAEVLGPDHSLMMMYRKGITKVAPGDVLENVLRRTGGAYETTTPLSAKHRADIREVAELTSDEQLLRIAELPEVPVSLEHFRQLDPQTRIVIGSRLDISPAETPRWLTVWEAARYTALRSEGGRLLRAGRGARIEENALPDGTFRRYVGPAAQEQSSHNPLTNR
jgi:hypothetical protein